MIFKSYQMYGITKTTHICESVIKCAFGMLFVVIEMIERFERVYYSRVHFTLFIRMICHDE